MNAGLAQAKIVPAPNERSVTVLGATGSMGASTLDLLRRDPQALSGRGRSPLGAMRRRSRGSRANLARALPSLPTRRPMPT